MGLHRTDVSVAVGIQNCGAPMPSSGRFRKQATCGATASLPPLGDFLIYSGPFSPQQVDSRSSDLRQTLYVQIPSDIKPGPALLSIVHFSLTNAGTVSTHMRAVSCFRWKADEFFTHVRVSTTTRRKPTSLSISTSLRRLSDQLDT